ncbi:hypothetical protein ACFL0U_00300 [Pseudomonadota bacterium]
MLIYFNSKSLYYYNLSIFNKREVKPALEINLASIDDFEKTTEKASVDLIDLKTIEEQEVIESRISTINTSTIVKSLEQIKTETEKISKAITELKYVAKPEIKTEDIKPEKKPEKEQQKKTSNTSEQKAEKENIIKEVISTNESKLGEELSKVTDGDDIKNVVKLSLRERVNIQRQIKSCYKMAIVRSGIDSKTKVLINVSLKRDGNIDMTKIKVVDEKKYDKLEEKEKEDFNIAITNAKNALIFCSPLRNLPSNKYKVWREMSLEFDSKNIDIDNAKL